VSICPWVQIVQPVIFPFLPSSSNLRLSPRSPMYTPLELTCSARRDIWWLVSMDVSRVLPRKAGEGYRAWGLRYLSGYLRLGARVKVFWERKPVSMLPGKPDWLSHNAASLTSGHPGDASNTRAPKCTGYLWCVGPVQLSLRRMDSESRDMKFRRQKEWGPRCASRTALIIPQSP
jgi:hypothetical protein